jgi:hypothetical protein
MRIFHKAKRVVAALMVAGGLAGMSVTLAPVPAMAAVDTTSVCSGVSLTGGACNGDEKQFTTVIKLIIQIISLIAGIAAVIMIVVGGLKYITSNGDSSSTASAKNTILYAIIGLVVVALAQVIVRYVLTTASK